MFWMVFSLLAAAAALCWLFWKVNQINSAYPPRNAFREMQDIDGPAEDEGPEFTAPAAEVPPLKPMPRLRIVGESEAEED
jgi:hypothetical protein